MIRKRHAFEGETLAVISSIKRRGVLLVLVILPNGSRSLVPAAWTDWRDADASPIDDDIDDTSSLGKLGDLLQLRKVIGENQYTIFRLTVHDLDVWPTPGHFRMQLSRHLANVFDHLAWISWAAASSAGRRGLRVS